MSKKRDAAAMFELMSLSSKGVSGKGGEEKRPETDPHAEAQPGQGGADTSPPAGEGPARRPATMPVPPSQAPEQAGRSQVTRGGAGSGPMNGAYASGSAPARGSGAGQVAPEPGGPVTGAPAQSPAGQGASSQGASAQGSPVLPTVAPRRAPAGGGGPEAPAGAGLGTPGQGGGVSALPQAAGRVEISMSYAMTGTVVLAMVVALLAAFWLGRVSVTGGGSDAEAGAELRAGWPEPTDAPEPGKWYLVVAAVDGGTPADQQVAQAKRDSFAAHGERAMVGTHGDKKIVVSLRGFDQRDSEAALSYARFVAEQLGYKQSKPGQTGPWLVQPR